MITHIILFVLLSLVSFIYYKVADKFNIIDKPNHRSSHLKPTIRGGGILFVLALVIYFIAADFSDPYFFAGMLLLAVVSFFDDLKDLSSRVRFSTQLVAMILLLFQVYTSLIPLWYFPLILFLGLALINSFNFMDGINGITGIYSLSSLIILHLINKVELIFNPDIFIYTAISIFVFGYFNFRKKALFFAGDIGSITIGFLLVFLTSKMFIELNAPLLILVVGVYGIDAGGTMIYRKFFTEEKWTEPHRHHIYQKLVDRKGLSHLSVACGYAAAQLGFGLIVYFTYDLPIINQWILAIPLAIFAICLYLLLFKWLNKNPNSLKL